MSALDEVFRLEQFGIKLGLDTIRALCAALGDPHRAYATIVVAGTNGKGSVTAMVERALRAAGHRSARYTSPHLSRLEERFAIGGVDIASERLEATAARVMDTVHQLIARGTLQAPPTFFEVTTAIACEAFREARVEVAVLEVGLGGRLDATNVAEPLAVAITSIDRDHEQQLGGTLEAIAAEKAGIIKPGAPVVIGPLAPGPREVVARIAAERGARLVPAHDGIAAVVEEEAGTCLLRVTTPVRGYGPVRLGLPGRHQADNAIVAVRLLEILETLGLRVGAHAVATGLADVSWPGRLEWIETAEGRVLLDAAHNPAGAASLATYLRGLGEPLPLVFGVVKDKDVRAMVAVLAPVVSRVVATQAATPRARDAGEVAAMVAEVAPALPVAAEAEPLAAVRDALRDVGRAVVAGSIFLIGDVRARLAK